ncbi:MAG TPA: amidohydrolase family protein [Bacillus sp. (in: firmicutes)]|uniref:amidohydrolase family protein n=1 Tax=Bacillus litorisediminis TaxID=2922713 RepID=UPI001FAD55EC|nr:amidohydrolase family protein [Bacillus litorisediminis]HWO76322.1 amidohydrolase family protein [Bacillus sp. (in: firmicutes)]
MKIIDAHIHFSNIKSFKETAEKRSGVDYSAKGIQKEFAEAGVVLGIGMGLTETDGLGFPDPKAQSPMGLDLEQAVPQSIVTCLGINPYTLNHQSLEKIEAEIQKDGVVGFKIYLGYYPFYAYDEIYQSIYQLAAAYQLPVVFHTGDTYSDRGLLKYSHPLTIDEVAVKNRNVNFMMAHLGDPWVLTAAEVINKNPNVYADLSGWIVGTQADLDKHRHGRFLDHIRHALSYCEQHEKLLFGTDWPLVPVKPYIDFIGELIPERYHEDVFYNTAVRLFPKLNPFL